MDMAERPEVAAWLLNWQVILASVDGARCIFWKDGSRENVCGGELLNGSEREPSEKVKKDAQDIKTRSQHPLLPTRPRKKKTSVFSN